VLEGTLESYVQPRGKAKHIGVEPGMNRGKLAWVPPFMAGAAAATAAELAAGLLLYSTLGFLRALTVVLTVQMGAIALGFWSASGQQRLGRVEAVRRRWLVCLVAFTAAAVYSGVWRFLGDNVTAALSQGLGLGLLGGLPLFAVAALLGSMGQLDRGVAGRPVSVGASATLGAGAGFLLTGFVFIPSLEASSTLLVCVIALSAGALVQGWVLDDGSPMDAVDPPAPSVAVDTLDEDPGAAS